MKFSSHKNLYACMDSASRMVPGFPQGSNIFYTSPTCSPTSLKSVFEKRCSVLPQKCCEAMHELGDQKGCFDFDQSGNHESLFSAGHPLQVSSSINMKIFDVNGRCVKDIVEREPVITESFKKSSWCGLDENSETDVRGSPVIEMQEEDKEELDALLFSNDGDEETSTGHSPVMCQNINGEKLVTVWKSLVLLHMLKGGDLIESMIHLSWILQTQAQHGNMRMMPTPAV